MKVTLAIVLAAAVVTLTAGLGAQRGGAPQPQPFKGLTATGGQRPTRVGLG